MATKDYVKRGRSPKPAPIKAKASPRKGKKAPTTGFPTSWAALAVILVCGLIASLFFLSGTDVPETAPVTPAAIVVKPQPAKTNTNALPPKPEEKWRYIQELENKKVIVPVLTPKQVIAEDKPTQPYLLQCGAYHSQAQADERKATIAFQGLNSQIKVSTNDKGTWYRVVLGPYKDKRLAMDDQNKLQQHGISPCAIWFWE
ncbi:cell division protein [Photobacterium phosphoreum]|uniref:SPOR domain-containing protein n=1 Tax=Photobacterium phosphoreum TaxID=659 RepID=UPI000D16F7EB|nr:SPOR domain-containing protein [Photobacterium phosphoreum]PSU64903.1 cell division protein [Photobacterium phosphoreum]PSU70196.1 cell division protein [Photobacterium phosphoreum]PSU82997.1 cell division protein [Photobacterium phosphoreum]PSU85358.1 cell division protein [Photobacterium phosphoreum]PSW33027.1 cell division protein [Photobacterium phosphoreum]